MAAMAAVAGNNYLYVIDTVRIVFLKNQIAFKGTIMGVVSSYQEKTQTPLPKPYLERHKGVD